MYPDVSIYGGYVKYLRVSACLLLLLLAVSARVCVGGGLLFRLLCSCASSSSILLTVHLCYPVLCLCVVMHYISILSVQIVYSVQLNCTDSNYRATE